MSTRDEPDLLGSLSDSQLGALLGVEIDWPARDLDRLAHVDFSRACLTVQGFPALQHLPENAYRTPCLIVEDHVADLEAFARFTHIETLVLRDVGDADAVLTRIKPTRLHSLVLDAGDLQRPRLSNFPNLRVLRINASTDERIGLGSVGMLSELVVLDLRDVPTLDVGALSGLTELVQLDLGNVETNEDLSSLGSLESLVRLTVGGAADDLSAIGGLQQLSYVNADFSTVAKLPDLYMPSLREFSALSTPVSDEAAARFAELNPQAVVEYKYENWLRRKVDGADRVRVVRTADCGATTQASLVGGIDAVQVFLDALEFKRQGIRVRVGCPGDTRLEFYRGAALLERVSLFSARRVVKCDAWETDVFLMDDSATRVQGWLDGLSEDSAETQE